MPYWDPDASQYLERMRRTLGILNVPRNVHWELCDFHGPPCAGRFFCRSDRENALEQAVRSRAVDEKGHDHAQRPCNQERQRRMAERLLDPIDNSPFHRVYERRNVLSREHAAATLGLLRVHLITPSS